MVKFIIMGLWVLLVTLGGLFIGYGMTNKSQVESVDIEIGAQGKRTQGSTETMNVPVMVEGGVKGYLLVQLTYIMDEKIQSDINLELAPFVHDAIFAEFFGAYTDVLQVEKMRFEPSRQRIIDNVNQRFGALILTDLLVQQFNFITVEKIREQQERGH